jgi:hypothetical protein
MDTNTLLIIIVVLLVWRRRIFLQAPIEGSFPAGVVASRPADRHVGL